MAERIRINFRLWRGKYIYLPNTSKMYPADRSRIDLLRDSDSGLEKFETLSLGKYHPISQRPFTPEEQAYIQFYADTYIHYNLDYPSIEFCVNYYQDLLRTGLPIISNRLAEVGYRFLDISDLHLKSSDRILAERCLNAPDSSNHRWLLRYSSLHDPTDEFGRQYYVLSYRLDPYSIQHVLFGFYPGYGWAMMSTEADTILVRSKWIPCFAEFLQNLLHQHGLKFPNQVYCGAVLQ